MHRPEEILFIFHSLSRIGHGDRSTDAPAPAGDQRDLAVQKTHGFSLAPAPVLLTTMYMTMYKKHQEVCHE